MFIIITAVFLSESFRVIKQSRVCAEGGGRRLSEVITNCFALLLLIHTYFLE
jgi:hypothetical protein